MNMGSCARTGNALPWELGHCQGDVPFTSSIHGKAVATVEHTVSIFRFIFSERSWSYTKMKGADDGRCTLTPYSAQTCAVLIVCLQMPNME